MRFELLFRDVLEAAPRRGRNFLAAGVRQEPLQKTHRLGSQIAKRHRPKRCRARAGNHGPGNIKGTVARNFRCKRGRLIALADFQSARPNQAARANCGNMGARAASPVLTVAPAPVRAGGRRPMLPIQTIDTRGLRSGRTRRCGGHSRRVRFLYPRFLRTDILRLLAETPAEERIPCGPSPS